MRLDKDAIASWLRETDGTRLEGLWREADRVRCESVGDDVHLRGLLEISNHCARSCGYCGVSALNPSVTRYRMAADEIVEGARLAASWGYGTLVMQSGEDYGIERDWLADVLRRVKGETGIAVTLSLGERPDEDLAAWRAAGADRYLLRFETTDRDLYDRIHPPLGRAVSDRFAALRRLRDMGYEPGSGIMIGIPGQSWASVADDILAFRDMDLDMIGVGPFLPHPGTPMGKGEGPVPLPQGEQALGDEISTCKVVALARLACPDANIPSTTALATFGPASRANGLVRGANVVMPNLTPIRYRKLYEIYPAKALVDESTDEIHRSIGRIIASLGRTVGQGPGGRRRA